MGRRRTGGSWPGGGSWLGVAVAALLVVSLLGEPAPADDSAGAPAPVQGVRAAVWPGMYVALGDSFAAGPWIPNQIPEAGGCQRSDHDYPHLAAPRMAMTLRDVTCSGAATADMTSPQDVRPRPAPPQLDALGPKTLVVTLTIGGNDIGFGEIVTSCSTITPWRTPCRDRYLAGGTDELSRRIRRTAPKVAAVLAEVRRRSPDATVLVVGYPSIVPDRGRGCWPSLPFAFDDVPYLRAKHKELNDMLATEAQAAGAVFVDTYGPSLGRDACALPPQRWVEPLVPLSPAAPVHPNARGMEGMATQVAARVGEASEVTAG